MTIVRLSAPGVHPAIEVEVPVGHGILVGRRPDLASLDPAALPMRTITRVAVPSGLVSENHLLLWNVGGEIHLRDLGSTNGSRWQLGAGAEVAARAAGAVDLELAGGGESLLKPAPAEWTNATEFRESVALQVATWLRENNIPASAAVARPGAGLPSDHEISLGGDHVLRLRAHQDGDRVQTENPRWLKAIPTLWAYVHAQRGLFEVERDSQHGPDFVLISPASRAVHRQICEATRRGLHGILQGESGVGKSMFARCFHDHSERRAGPYVQTNLGEDSDDRRYFQLKLFGARAGAAEGITRDRIGLVKAADGGTLFLDEIGELPLDVQGLLLQFLDSGTFRRLGDSGEVPDQRANVRVVVGTNADLREAVRRGKFREDLWWRLCGIVVEVPPLRRRRDDVAAFLRGQTITLEGGETSVFEALAPEARRFLLDGHPWRGNFRELRSFAARLPLFVEGATIERAHCEAALAVGSLTRPDATSGPGPSAPVAAAEGGADLLPLAQRLLPRWLEVRPPKSNDNFDQRRPGQKVACEFRILMDEVVRSLALARMLGVEGWTELPRRPDPSYQAMAEAMGFGDGKSVQDALRIYVELRRLM